MKKIYFLFTLLLAHIHIACNDNSAHTINESKASNPEEVVPKRVLLVLTSNSFIGDTQIPTGFWLKEAALPWKVFIKAGIQVDFASPNGGRVPVDENSYNYMDSTTEEAMKDTAFIAAIDNTISLANVDAQDYDGVLYVGGHGPMWDFPENEDISRITLQLYEKDKVVAAICHGTAALINTKLSDGRYLVENKSLTAISNEEEKAFESNNLLPFFLESTLTDRGARFTKNDPWQANVVVSGNLITGQNPASAEGLAQAMLAKMQEEKKTISDQRFWKLMEDITNIGNFIAAVPSDGASANILGKFEVKHDGRENVLQIIGGKDHVHIDYKQLAYIGFKYIDVGYGPEPCILLVNHQEAPFLKLFYMGADKEEKQQEFFEANSDLKSLFKGNW